VDPLLILRKYYSEESLAWSILVRHSNAVALKAVSVARNLSLPDGEIQFIQEACLLHDIGIFYTQAPEIGCYGELPYICHGYLGHDLLVSEGFPEHAKVCERHTGAGLTKEDIILQNLPIPRRNMVPVSLAEEIIAYSDKFYSKDPQRLYQEQCVAEILTSLARHGQEKSDIFAEWHKRFGQ
jgi:uncharacterized protein